MATVNQEKMLEIAGNMSSTATKLKTDLNTATTAAENAKGKVEEAKAYDGQELDGNRSHYSEKGGKNPKTIFHYAHVKADNGTAESGLENIIGKDKDNITEIIDKIITFAENDIPEVVDCINEQREIVETGLADYEKKYETEENGGIVSFVVDAVTAVVNNVAEMARQGIEQAEENLTSGNNTPTGPTGNTGYQNNPVTTPQYRQADDTQANTTTTKPNTSNTSTKPNTSNTPTETNTSNTATEPNTPTETNTSNTATEPNTPTETNTPTEPNTPIDPETNQDNPTPTITVPTQTPTHTGGGYSVSQAETPIEQTTPEETADSITSITEDIINKGKDHSIVPESSEEAVSSSSGSAVIPVAAGLSTAAAAAIGAKVILDKRKEDEDDIKVKKWSGDINTDIDYNDGIQQQEILDDDEPEEKSTSFSDELTDIQ